MLVIDGSRFLRMSEISKARYFIVDEDVSRKAQYKYT